MHRDRALARPPSMCVRDYMNFLEQNCSELNHNLCRFYVDTYERARFRYLCGRVFSSADVYYVDLVTRDTSSVVVVLHFSNIPQ